MHPMPICDSTKLESADYTLSIVFHLLHIICIVLYCDYCIVLSYCVVFEQFLFWNTSSGQEDPHHILPDVIVQWK